MANEKKTRYIELRDPDNGKKLYTRSQVYMQTGIDEKRLQRIENGEIPNPDEVKKLSELYKTPSLCNYYCSEECPIGMDIVPKVEMTENLTQIVMGLLSSLNSAEKNKDKLIDICSDGVISDGEVYDFVTIQEELEKLSLAVETLQIWCKRMAQRDKVEVLSTDYREEWNARNKKNKV